MATNWLDFYAKCPFYKKTDGKQKVVCEWIPDTSDLIWRFGDGEKLRRHVKSVCSGSYKGCPVYRILCEIYEKGENNDWK